MAKTTNHPPYEIDPWKADITKPPSNRPFNPEIVESEGRPKQKTVPPEPTEGQKKIEDSISRVERFDNEMNALREQQQAVLDEVEEGIKETNEKIKQLNDLEERIKQQVEGQTDETDKYLREAEQLRAELEEAKSQMNQAVNDATNAISAVDKAQKDLDAYKEGASEQMDRVQNEAIKANSLALQNQQAINNRTSGLVAAHTKAIDSNRKAIRALAKIDLGGSLLAYMPLTDEEIDSGLTREHTPAWAANATNVANNSAKGYEFVGSFGGRVDCAEVYAQVSPGTRYLLDIELLPAESVDINIFFKTSNSNISNPIKRYFHTKDDGYGGLATHYPLENEDHFFISYAYDYNRFRFIVEFKDDVEDIYLSKMQWTKGNSFTIKNLSFVPYIPSQAAIDAKQDKILNDLKRTVEFERKTTKKLEEFTKELHKSSTGVIHLKRNEVAGTYVHGVGFEMPDFRRIFKIYARTDFVGNLTVLVNYATGLTGGAVAYYVQSKNMSRKHNPHQNINSPTINRSIFQGQSSYKDYDLKIPVGDVQSIIVFVDHIDWERK